MNNLKKNIQELLRPNIRSLKPYSSARDEFQSDNPASSFVFLDANENSLGSPLPEDFSRYPSSDHPALKAAVATREALSPGQVFLGNGSDEAIDLLLRAFCVPDRDNVVLLPPTYGMYAVQANIHGAAIREAPLRPDFSPDPEAVRAVTDAHSKILFLCSPNNPTGQHLPESFILECLSTFPGIVVADEAYGDFSDRPSLCRRLGEFPNLVVLKTFSKAWGLAGLRLGTAFADPEIIGALNRIRYPYNLNSVSVRLVLEALARPALIGEKIAVLRAERGRLAEALWRSPAVREVYPSDANFLLVRTTDAGKWYRHLVRNGIVVRNRTHEKHCENCLRITVGTPAENDGLLAVLNMEPE